MTEQEARKYSNAHGAKFGMSIPLEEQAEDKYGKYYTGSFLYKGKDVFITIDNGKWHLSVSTNHPLGYNEMKELRYMFLPDSISVAQIFPPRGEFVNIHENCYHLWQL